MKKPVNFNLAAIAVFESKFPSDKVPAVPLAELAWQYGYTISVHRFPDKTLAEIGFDCSLSRAEEEDTDENVLNLEISNSYAITGAHEEADKLEMLRVMHHSALCIVQGFYAARTEGSAYEGLIPPEDVPNPEYFQKIIRDEWTW